MYRRYPKNNNKNQECSTKVNTSESKLARMLAIDSSEEDESSNTEKKVVLKQPPHKGLKQRNTSELEAMMAKLKKNIAVVLDFGDKRNEATSEHHIFIRLDLLNTYIDQVLNIKDFIKKGGTIFTESLFALQKKTNDTLNKIRDDVLKAYLELETEGKYNIARQGGKTSNVFTVIGIIERELHSTFEKISQAINKRNEHRQKNNKAVPDLFTSFKSLPALNSLKQRPKANIRKNLKDKKYLDNSQPENIPPDKRKVFKYNEANDHLMKNQISDIPDHRTLANTALENSIASCLHNLEEQLKNNKSALQKSSDNEMYEDCTGPTELGHLEYKATGFEISISDENIQIKIPTSVIYLVQNTNYKSEGEQDDQFFDRKTGHISVNFPTTGSVTDFNTENTMSLESVSSIYTDIVTDSEIGMDFVRSCSVKNKLVCNQNNSKKKRIVINHDKCVPFFSENGYCNTISKENGIEKSIQSSEANTEKAGLEKINENYSIFSSLKENKNLSSQFESNVCNLNSPLFGNILQLVDLIKKIYCDCNNKLTCGPNEKFEILSNVDKKKSATSNALQHCNESPPSISLSSLECPSIWKESARSLCELCPGCANLSKIPNEVV